MLQLVKQALRITTNAFDDEINHLIQAALLDLGFNGISAEVRVEDYDETVNQAVITYVKMNFGAPTDFDKFERAYNSLKTQMGTSSLYTEFE